jgi:hypothetical protein
MLPSDVFELILAGQPAVDVAPSLTQLPSDDRQNVLCTVCAMHDEIARNCLKTATEVSKLLTAECPFYVNGIATGLLK